jgi:hypothetical protein
VTRATSAFGVLEVVTKVAPLGVRPWDVHTGAPVMEGIELTLEDGQGAPRRAVRTPSGVLALHGLPGLAEAERGTGEPAYWYHPPVERGYRVTLRDLQSRYLPMCLDVRAPFPGLYRPSCAFPELDAPVVPVFSSCARFTPSGFATVRAQLELDSGGPAAWARLDLFLPDGGVARGVADAEGRVAVLFPYPEPPVPPTGPIAAASWTVQLDAHWGRGAPRQPVAAARTLPELCDVLQQRPARLLADGQHDLTHALLTFGRQLVLHTTGRSTLLTTATT